jgi:hypothetical protein
MEGIMRTQGKWEVIRELWDEGEYKDFIWSKKEGHHSSVFIGEIMEGSDAEFICKAVNNHEKMKKNLQLSTEILYVFKKHYADSQGILEGINIQIANNEQLLEVIE